MNFRYQLTLRPFSFCTVPKGFIPGSAKGLQIRANDYGSIAYPVKLSADDVAAWDLKYIGEETEAETFHQCTSDCRRVGCEAVAARDHNRY